MKNCSSLQPFLSSVRGTCRAGEGFQKDWRAWTSPMQLLSTAMCVLVSELPVTAAANVSCFVLPLSTRAGPWQWRLLAGCFAGGCGSEGQLELQLPASGFGVTVPPALGKHELGDWLAGAPPPPSGSGSVVRFPAHLGLFEVISRLVERTEL